MFPSSPAVNETAVVGRRVWIWDGAKWLQMPFSTTQLGIGTETPSSALNVAAPAWTVPSLVYRDPAVQSWGQSYAASELAAGVAWAPYGGALWFQGRNNGIAQPLFFNLLGGEVSIGYINSNVRPWAQLLVTQILSANTEPGLTTDSTPVASFYGESYSVNASFPELAIFASTVWPGSMVLQSRRFQTPAEALPLSLNPLGGNVGIGVQNPQAALDVTSPDNAYVARFSNAGTFAGIILDHTDPIGGESVVSFRDSGLERAVIAYDSDEDRLTFFTGLKDAAQATLTCDTNSRVGIGTTNPAYLLDVNGDINLTGVLRINGVQVLP